MRRDGRKSNKFSVNANTVKTTCEYCSCQVSVAGIKTHMKFCYLNPVNLKLCKICNSPIKNYRTNITCSYGCANSLFRSGPNNPNWKDNTYVTTCFLYHSHKCVVCGETNVVAVHHFDGDKKNNNPCNLVPLCPTHHQYMHSRYRDLIYEDVHDYLKSFGVAGHDPAAPCSQSKCSPN